MAGRNPCLKLAILQKPWGEGALWFLIFKNNLSGQLTVAHRWLTAPPDDASVSLEAAYVGSYEALSHLVYRGLKAPYPLTFSMRSVKAWVMAQGGRSPSSTRLSFNTPLWRNPNLIHFFGYLDPVVWTKYGIKTLLHIVPNGTLL